MKRNKITLPYFLFIFYFLNNDGLILYAYHLLLLITAVFKWVKRILDFILRSFRCWNMLSQHLYLRELNRNIEKCHENLYEVL